MFLCRYSMFLLKSTFNELCSAAWFSFLLIYSHSFRLACISVPMNYQKGNNKVAVVSGTIYRLDNISYGSGPTRWSGMCSECEAQNTPRDWLKTVVMCVCVLLLIPLIFMHKVFTTSIRDNCQLFQVQNSHRVFPLIPRPPPLYVV